MRARTEGVSVTPALPARPVKVVGSPVRLGAGLDEQKRSLSRAVGVLVWQPA